MGNHRQCCRGGGESSRLKLFSNDYAKCLVDERYRDSETLLAHFATLGETSAAIFETCSASGELCGTPSPELLKVLEGAPGRIFSPYQPLEWKRG